MTQEREPLLPLVTPHLIRNAVILDRQTRLWFRRLFASPQVAARFREARGCSYGRYRALSLMATVLLVLAAGSCAVGVSTMERRAPIFLVLSALMAMGGVICLRKARQVLAALAAALVEQDLPGFPPGMTLYQMGEIYSRKYDIPSLVDTIWLWDHWLRNVFLLIYFSTFGVYFLPFWKMIVWTTAGCLLTMMVVEAIVLGKRKR